MRRLTLAPVLSPAEAKALRGHYVTLAGGYTLPDGDLLVENGAGHFLACYLRGQISPELQEAARPGLLRVSGEPSNRGAAAGSPLLHRLRKDGTLSRRRGVALKVLKLLCAKTDQLGGFAYGRGAAMVCRRTTWSLRDPEVENLLLPLVERVNELARVYLPQQYAAQMLALEGVPEHLRLPGCFTTATVNRNWRTATHTDAGDLRGGFAALLADGTYTGGQLLLPRYRVGFDVQRGDCLLLDPLEWHGNAPLQGERLSVVLYAMESLLRCPPNL